MKNPIEIKILYSISVLLPVILGASIVDSNPRLSRLLRMLGFTAPVLMLLFTQLIHLLDYQLCLTLVSIVVAIGVSLHNEAYYKVLYGVSRYFQVVVDTALAALILLFSSSFFIELIVYWFFIDIIVALIAITMEYGVENLPVSSTYIVMCIAPSDIALITMWALLVSKYGLMSSLLLEINSPIQQIPLDPLISIILAFGFATKIGQFPLHSWLPIVHGKSPSHVSAILSGLIIKIGAYAFFLSTQLFTLDKIAFYMLLVQGVISTIYGAFGAILQTHLKWLLAYSSVSYGGIITSFFATYILTGIEPLRLLVLFVIVFHALTKSLSFLNSGLVYQVANTYDVYRLGYLYYVTRKGALSAFTALLSLTGIPPSIGFTVKLLLLLASINLSLIHILGIPLLVAIVLSSVFSIAYSAKFMGVYISSIPRITPRLIPIPQLELNAEIYLGAASLILPLSILLYTYYAGFLDSVFTILLIAIYAITFTAYTLLFTRIYTKPDIPEDVKYWLSGVES